MALRTTWAIGSSVFREFSANLAAKLAHPDFVADLEQLTAYSSPRYDAALAADLIMERLGSRFPGAPSLRRDRRRSLALHRGGRELTPSPRTAEAGAACEASVSQITLVEERAEEGVDPYPNNFIEPEQSGNHC